MCGAQVGSGDPVDTDLRQRTDLGKKLGGFVAQGTPANQATTNDKWPSTRNRLPVRSCASTLFFLLHPCFPPSTRLSALFTTLYELARRLFDSLPLFASLSPPVAYIRRFLLSLHNLPISPPFFSLFKGASLAICSILSHCVLAPCSDFVDYCHSLNFVR